MNILVNLPFEFLRKLYCFCGRKLSLEPQSGIVLFGISGTGRRPNPQGFAQSHASLGQVLIRQEWEASLSDIGLSKILRIKPTPYAANSKKDNT